MQNHSQKKIVIAAGAFKQSLSAPQAAKAIRRGLMRSGLYAHYIVMPTADGGNGTLDIFLSNSADSERIEISVDNPLGRPIKAAYGLIKNRKTAVIEMALASGLELLTPEEFDPLRASTYGTGQLMQAALEHGIERLIIGLGGSATVDGGAGCLQALGIQLLDAQGHPIPRGGGFLEQIVTIDASGLDPRWHHVEIIIASDVENPTLGPKGAAAVFGPQKGATPEQVAVLEHNLSHFFDLTHTQHQRDVRHIQGGGAAGAFAAGLMAYLEGHIESGIDLVLDTAGFDHHLLDADLVITSEGRIDEQTIDGKGPIGIARRAQREHVPTIVFVGGLQGDESVLHGAGIAAVIPITSRPMALQEALENAEILLENAALRTGYLLQIGWQPS